jgi:hypothetical protein
MHNGHLNADDFHAFAAGYYEGIEHVDRISKDNIENSDYRLRDDFLRFEYRPGVNRPYAAGMRVTNRFGMASPNYDYDKPPHTRRIAWLGDSISIGPYGHSFETLLEARLNRDYTTPNIQKYEVLNFSVPGYILLQEMDVALEKAPKFHPDVYVVALTSQEIVGSRKHVARLIVNGRNLKYDFLRQEVAQAGVSSSDHLPIIITKLRPFFNPMTKTALEQIKEHARAQGAQMLIALVPAPIDPDVTASDFNQLHAAIDAVGVPVIDVRDTFRSEKNLAQLQVSESDPHPNMRGHEMIYESLYSSLYANPSAWKALTGSQPRSKNP